MDETDKEPHRGLPYNSSFFRRFPYDILTAEIILYFSRGCATKPFKGGALHS
jgi:hypothetical protein